jgi:acyl phosphate:glycerol-3-phosphate acyltransferase
MAIILILVCVILGYFFGSFPSGLVVVRVATGKDVREVGSGRTGGTNAFRAAGAAAGILTGVLDGFKGAIAVWVATFITGGNPFTGLPGNHYAEVFAGLAAVLGHIYSIFLVQRDEQGKLHFKGGAGGGPSVGAAAGLWIWSLAFIVPVGLFAFFVIGYASITTLSFGLVALIIFIVRYALGYGPWEHILYGVLVLALQIWALRPNFPRLRDGTERAHSGWAKRRAARIAGQTPAPQK